MSHVQIPVLTGRSLFAVQTGADHLPVSNGEGKMRILLIDDDPILREIITKMLVSEGHTVSQSAGGRMGLPSHSIQRLEG